MFSIENLTHTLGKSTALISAASFGISAAGFIIGFASEFGFKASSSLFLDAAVYGSAAIVAANAAYRIWNIVKNGAPAGLKLISSLSKIRISEAAGIMLSMSAGATYGGLVYLGCSQIIKLPTNLSEMMFAVLIILSNTIANGSVFSYSWLNNIRNKTLFSCKKSTFSSFLLKLPLAFLALFGLGCTMSLGAIGLTKSITGGLSFFEAAVIGTTITIGGFLGEAPFSIKQAQLLAKKFNASQHSLHSGLFDTASFLLYLAYSFCATYTGIGDFPTALKIIFALGSQYLSFISCLKEDYSVSEVLLENSVLEERTQVAGMQEMGLPRPKYCCSIMRLCQKKQAERPLLPQA